MTLHRILTRVGETELPVASSDEKGLLWCDEYRQMNSKLADPVSRTGKAEKILAVLREFARLDLGSLTCADFGAGSGIVAARIATEVAWVIAIDLDATGLGVGRTEFQRGNVSYIVADATRTPLADGSCDVIICTHVYEHVDSAERLVAEIERVLKPTGVCYFSGPNRLRLYEPHLRLWLVHWLPRSVLNVVLRRFQRPAYAENLRTWWSLRRLLARFEVVDLNIELVRDPKRFHTEAEPGIGLARFLPVVLLRWLLPVVAPSFNVLLTRREKRIEG